ncbi:hypothetical protein BDY24DRAFT_390932 [Mrakia frigida]|uniref:uncharacterized protein n=1 Tax=Mrakia frigida TaxID=29902 RepID=UPI003FCC252F
MSLSTLPNDVLLVSLLPILQARLEKQDLFHLSLVSHQLSSLLRPILFHTLVFTIGQPSSLERVRALTSSPDLASLVQKVVFEADEEEEGEEEGFVEAWTAFLPLLVSLRTIACNKGIPSEDFWTILENLPSISPKVIEIEDGFLEDEQLPPSFFLLTGLEEIRFEGDHQRFHVLYRRSVSGKVEDMVSRNSSTLKKIEIRSSALYMNKVLAPDLDTTPTFPSLTSLEITANLDGTMYFDRPHSSLQPWFLSLLEHTSPVLQSISIHTGVISMRSQNGQIHMAPGGFLATSSTNFGSFNVLQTDALPLSETTLLPLLLNAETVAQMGRVRRLEIGRPPEGKRGEQEWVPFGRKDATEVFDALKGLKGLRDLSVTLGEIGEDLVGMIAAVGAAVGLERLEIELRVGKDDEEATGDGLLWSEVLGPLSSSLSPLAPTLRALVVCDNRISKERTSLFHPDHPNSVEQSTPSFDFLPTVLLFAKQLPKLTSIRWITRDGAKGDEVVRDQLWVATTKGGWMRLVG